MTDPLPAVMPDEISVEQLRRFVANPVRAFLNERLGVRLETVEDVSVEEIPVELDALQTYQIAEDMLQRRRIGKELDQWDAAARARGALPPGALADAQLASVRAVVDALLAHADTIAEPFRVPERLRVDCDLDGQRVTGVLTNLVGDDLLTVTYGSLKPKRRLAAWVDLLVASLVCPERAIRGILIGRKQDKAEAYVIGPLADEPAGRQRTAREQLQVVVDLFLRGMREPLPLYCATSHAWAQRLHDDGDRGRAEADAAKAWETNMFAPEMLDPGHLLVYSGERGFTDVLAELARADECAPGWQGWLEDDRSRFARYAARLWKPLLDNERRVVAETGGQNT